MEFRQIRYALSVARERSFTKAALRLNVSQSSVSEQVRQLEERIGFSLFRRVGRGVELTERGRTFLHEAERVANDLMSLDDVARRLSGVGGETISVGIASGLATSLLPCFLHSEVIPDSFHLEIKTAPPRLLFEELYFDRLDLGIAVEVGADRIPAGLLPERLFETQMVIIMPPSHRLADGRSSIDLALLANEPFVVNEPSLGYGQIVSQMFEDFGMRPRIRATVDNVETIKVVVLTGAGIAAIPAGSAENEVRLGQLVTIPVAPSRDLTISAYRSKRAMSRRKEAVLQDIIRVLRQSRGPVSST
ncbi:LysR family transcriptional regulator [Bradyrhizobium sp.]|uniref:LysR family transcriptional regulator n=1 Tax=Bradyrhizobium sp. TaxID=376 RepID=UPI0039E31A0C